MAHKATVVNVEQVNDGQIAVHVQCCADPTTETRHTFDIYKMTQNDIDAEVEQHKSAAETKHQHMQDALAHLKDKVGK